jgi:cell division protein FtsI (penicillin-binding protein 3)
MVHRRLAWLAGLVLLWVAAIFFKIVSLQVVHHREYASLARANQEVVNETPAPRGTIFDRMGQPLAMSVPGKSVYINPLKVDIGSASDLLSRVLGLDRAELYARMARARNNHRGDLLVERRITEEELQLIRKQPVGYIDVREAKERHYPNGSLAAHVLGSVDFEEAGNAGIEKALDGELRGIPGRDMVLTDVKRRPIDSRVATEAKPGEPLTLTIDERLQYVAEREIAAAVDAHNAASGSVVAIDPNNGDILALASYPTYDPNLPPGPGESPIARQNHAVSVPFEPGSVFKVITLSAALETTDLRPESPINCHGGVLQLPGRIIHDSHLGNGVMSMADVLAKSSNVGAIQVGLRVGQENMYEYVRRFGFGQRTGIQLPAESPGRFRKLENWGKTSLASVAFGQEISVTTLQLAQAASAVANGGLLVRPRLILKKGSRTIAPERPVRILKPDTAITMRQMMEGVVTHGTGSRARLVGYTVGGKTGSAQIYDYAARVYTHTYNGSFMGFAPLMNPQVVVVVTLNATHGEAGFGGQAAAPVFKVVATEALRILDVPKDLPDEPVKTLLAKAKAKDMDAPPVDSGVPQFNVLDDRADDDASAAAAPAYSGPKVPNFRGMTKRAVLEEALAKGLRVLPDGSGIAGVQDPAPGSPLREGERIRVVFAR